MLNLSYQKLAFLAIFAEIFFKSAAFKLDDRITQGYHKDDYLLAKYLVSVRVVYPETYYGANHFCGGSILNAYVIITAAHCVIHSNGDNRDASNLMIIAGSKHRVKREKGIQQRKVNYYVTHPNFDYDKKEADIALLFLRQDLNEDGLTVMRVPLNYEKPVPGWDCRTLGWGSVFANGPSPDRILYADVVIAPTRQCSWLSPNTFESHICTMDILESGVDICDGDSGGPLICNDGKLTGVSSFGYGCGEGHPAYFTNVSHYIDWILENYAKRKIASVLLLLVSAFINYAVN